ncbi:MAG: IS1595 family transposase [Deltaproteobacteria bacterium]|nr:IS1595 family transposase [Deltaproteobacteria bacterium]
MARKAPGKSHRKGLTFMEVADMFRDEETARDWIAAQRWPNGPHCPRCGTTNVQTGIKHKTMTHRCRECMTGKSKTMFSIKTGTVMEASNLPYRAWAVGIYLFTTNIKGVSSMRLHRELGISQKAAWFMLHRLRQTFEAEKGAFSGPVEVDETYMGGKMKNMHGKQRRKARQKPDYGKTIVAGARDRATGAVRAQAVEAADRETLSAFIGAHAAPGATIYTDEGAPYRSMENRESVKHSAGEYVRDDGVSTNGIESFWSMLKRGHVGTFHKMSPKHMDRYVQEFAGRHNIRDADTIDQMKGVIAGMAGKRLRYSDLIADNGLDSGARS